MIRELHILNDYLGGFIKGKLLDSLIIGVICMVFTACTNMPYAVLISVVIGVTNIIPFFGPFIGAVPGALLALMDDPIMFVVFIIWIIVLWKLLSRMIWRQSVLLTRQSISLLNKCKCG